MLIYYPCIFSILFIFERYFHASSNYRLTGFSLSFRMFKLFFQNCTVFLFAVLLKTDLVWFLCLAFCTKYIFFFGCIKDGLSLILILSNLIMMCLGVFFIFILLGIYSSSWICGLIVSSNLENCLPYILKYFFSPILSQNSSYEYFGLLNTVSHSLWIFFYISRNFFSLFFYNFQLCEFTCSSFFLKIFH